MLEVSHLCKSYGPIQSVQELSFAIGDNETVGLLGRNGAGKSTTMRMLAGYLAPTSGKIELCGCDMIENPREAKRHIGYLPELPPLYMDMTVREHLRFLCALRGVEKRQVAGECGRVCELLNIAHVEGRAIGHLSKGYRQRVGFAAALIGKPKLLILDEPTVGLDPQQIIDIRKLILELSQSMSILISSHILSEIAGVCSRVMILHQGKIAADGSAADIEARYRRDTLLTLTVKGEANLAAGVIQNCLSEGVRMIGQQARGQGETEFTLAAGCRKDLPETLFRALAGHSGELAMTALQTHSPSLEDIFIEITGGAGNPGSREGEEANV